MDQAEEREIIKRVMEGERRMFAVLVDAYKGPLFSLAFRMTGSYQDADDLTQETFIQAYRNLARFHPDKKFFTWLYTISLNLIRNHIKKKTRNPAFFDPEKSSHFLVHIPTECDNENEVEENIRKLEHAILTLPVEMREAILLKFHSDLTFEEMAAATGKSVSALKMRVYRGLKKLRKQLENKK